ncbi:uncharacterized protein HMPREF1541_05289 [Cyphellophora europaea CBS 101466]|uniref:ATP-dependent RNA helicase n=1 Tax=Cyphellophora europaea (strain CBS 101466) TaxID=1220924 RepID=W2RRH8_CYPE1|nr:uncharacterized protein HMPREF1541_05289 [Cyphellophora europaea CBS 101466]ETN39067.1 hypothetical protein HMPREF1541_05289 [Cyphellophora europaea CBS 101466]
MPPYKAPRGARQRRNSHGVKNAPVMKRPAQPKAESPQVVQPLISDDISPEAMRFADLANDKLLEPIIIDTITQDLGFTHMTPIQEATVHDLLTNRVDCLAQARTGTGKTLAFLLPAIQTLLKKPRRHGKISTLIISPTRELAMQIAKEACGLLGRLPMYKVSCAIGGTNKDREERDILSGCDILVATPGRLYDHLSDSRILASFSELDTLVLDEADRLLDMGFMKDLKDIIACLPDRQQKPRHGMLFSATIADHVEKFAHLVLSPGYKFISTIPAGQRNTHERVIQQLITVPTFSDVLPALISAIKSEMALDKDFKAIVFAPTAALADWYSMTLAEVRGLPPVSTLHARISQSKRTSVTDAFRKSSSVILVATDVVARGMDFPEVSAVFQVGLPADRESYIHRLGRTARAGREGRGIFIIAEAEAFFPKYKLKDIEFLSAGTTIAAEDAELVQKAAAKANIQGKVYQSWLGYYKAHLKALNWTPEKLVAEANRYAIDALCAGGVPEIQKSTVGKMGLKGVKNLNIVANIPSAGRGGGGGGGGGEGRRGGGEGRRGGNRGRGRGRGSG